MLYVPIKTSNFKKCFFSNVFFLLVNAKPLVIGGSKNFYTND